MAYIPDLEDISPLYGLTQLERLWIGCNNYVPQEQVAQMQAQQAAAMLEQRNDLEDIEDAEVLPDSGEPFVISQTIDGDRDGLPE